MRAATLCIVMIVLILGVSQISFAQVFNVSNSLELQQALTTAQSNGDDDTINVAAGTYNLTSTLIYSATENKKLTIQGASNNTSILDGKLTNQILSIDTTKPSSDSSSVITVKNIVFQNGKNIAGNGGGLYINTRAGSIDVENSSFINNTASGNGGGLYARSFIIGAAAGSVYIRNNYFYGNTGYDGGGAYVHNDAAYSFATVLLVNNVVANNKANNNGGGIHAAVFTYGTLYSNNNTSYNNTSSISGGGYYIDARASSTANIYNNISWGNLSANGKDIYVFDYGTINLYNNDYTYFTIAHGNDFSQANNISVDPQLSATYHLNSTSPCINAGNNAAQQLPSTDKDGNPRILNSVIDIGAYEYKVGSVPYITSFSVPATSSSLTVPILSFTGSDDTGVIGYMISESSTVPSIDDVRWSASPQQNYTFDNSGTKVIYAWIKDSTGYISTPQNATVSITLANPVLSLTVVGNGSVNSIPSGFSCVSSFCTSTFANGTSITLQATPSANFNFSGWSGDCTGIGDCSITLSKDISVTATFTLVHPVKLVNNGTTYVNIEDAYNAITNESSADIITRMTTINNEVYLGRNVDVVLSGGYDIYFSNSLGVTDLAGSLTVGMGSLMIENIAIR